MNEIIVGIDEAGRAPLAGRVYAAAVILQPECPISGLNDSKKIPHEKRKILYKEIIEKSIAYGVAYAETDEIESINILQATFLAMKRALEKIEHKFHKVLVDGNIYPFKNNYHGEAIIKGDTKIPEIMAASILAKVDRDYYMFDMDKLYPDYQFAKHKGYPTKLHRDLIKKHGPSPIHRRGFKGVKEFI